MDGYLVEKVFQSGRHAAIGPLLFGQAQIVAADNAERWKWGWDDGWMYDSVAAALAAWDNWDGTGEPSGWVRHSPSYRRRPGGDPAQEHARE